MTVYGAIPRGAYKRMPRQMPRSWGFERYALRFDGDDYVSQPWSNINQDMTWAIWIKTSESVDEMRAMLSRDGTDRNIHGFTINRFGTGLITWWRQEDGWGTEYKATSSTNVTHGRWHFITGTYDHSSGDMVIFVDSEQEDSDTGATADLTTPEEVWIGSQTGGGSYYLGLIPLACIYNRVLSAEEIRYNMLNYHNPIQDGLIGWWPMEEGQGTKVHDRSGNGNDGSISGATWEKVKQHELRAQAGL